VFVDVANGEEQEQKESYINDEEAEAVVDYIKTHSEINLSDLAVMSPFRTQALQIKNILSLRDDISKKLA
jgi:superfamily I DNA and/or RNA helicase